MNDEASKQLTDARFKRFVGVQRTTFEEMLAVLKTAYQLKHAKGGRKPKLSLEDLLMATLQYVREYRTYEEIAADFGIHESNLLRRSQWVEVTLVQSGVTISRTPLSSEDTVMIDATEVQINRPKKSKQLRAALERIDSTKAYSVEEAVALAKETNFAKFDATVEVAYNLNIDVKKADQQIRGAMVLPNGTGKTSRVLVFARGAKAEEAKAAGADFVGEDDLVAKINDGWLDFDVVIATPDMMALVGRLGRVLGPRNLMPNPKTGTVTMDVAKAVEESKGGKITYRADRAGNVQAIIGKVSFEAEKLVENFKAFNETIQKAKPATAKGTYVTNLTITTTQGVGIKVDVNSL
ncbi:50S ribosomal protein L1 [Streptococcus pneumoniae]|nr:50S ribosomal protein L1 [Streptococcus pneumoniae]